MITRMALVGVSLALVVGCTSSGSDPGDPAEPGGSASTSVSQSASSALEPEAGNGALITRDWDGAEQTVNAYPIDAAGSPGPAVEVMSGRADDSAYSEVIDGVWPVLLTGDFADRRTTELQVQGAGGEAVTEIPAPQWCGRDRSGGYRWCVLLDADRVARSTGLGRDPVSGAGPGEGSVIVSSLTDGSTRAEHGPFPDLMFVMGTTSADHLMLVTTPFIKDGIAPSTVLRLDLGDGTTSEVGVSPAGWIPTCSIGADAALGGGFAAGPSWAVTIVGSAQAADIQVDTGPPIGCSADGRFLYVSKYSAEPAAEEEATAPPDVPPAIVERIEIASGARESVLELDPGVFSETPTR